MSNPFSFIVTFFKKLFGNNGAAVQNLLHEASSFVNLAEPIVEEVDTEVKALIVLDPSSKASIVEKYIQKYETDAQKVSGIVQSLTGMPEADMYRNLASYVLGLVIPGGGASAALINLAIELAYNIVKAKTAAPVAKAA